LQHFVDRLQARGQVCDNFTAWESLASYAQWAVRWKLTDYYLRIEPWIEAHHDFPALDAARSRYALPFKQVTVKFQAHIADAESTLDEPFRVPMGGGDATRYDYWKRMEFTPERWAGLVGHARDAGLMFLASPFSVAAVELLERLGVPAWKVGSGEYASRDLFRAMAATGKPVLLSTGMSRKEEIAEAVRRLESLGAPFALFQCTSKYPTALEDVGLNVIDGLRERFRCPVGLSDHSGSPWPALAAMARGADMVELHLVFDRRMGGADAPASLTIDEFRQVRAARDAFQVMDAAPVDKDAMAEALSDMRGLFTKSIAPVRALAAGTVLEADMLASKKPGTGIPAAEISNLVGRRLKRDVGPERLLNLEDLDA